MQKKTCGIRGDCCGHQAVTRRFRAAALWAALVVLLTSAETQARPSMSLKEAVDAAWARQPVARSLQDRQRAGAATAQVARAWTPEPVALEASLKTDAPGNSGGGREIVAGVSVPIWLPGERDRSRAFAAAQLVALDGRVAAAKWRIVGAVRDAWWAAQLADTDLAAAESRLGPIRQLAGDVARRVRAGDLARADQHQADAAVLSAQADLAAAAAAQQQALHALQALIGVAATMATPSVAPTEASDPDESLLSAHPLLRELADKAELARRALDLVVVQKRAHPELALQATRERGAVGEAYRQSLTLGLRFPLGSDDRQQAKAADAKAELVEAEALLANERDRVAAQARAAGAQRSGALGVLYATERRVALAREARGFYDKAFRLGQVELATRLRIEIEAGDAERQLNRARVEVAHALSSMQQAFGVMLR